MEFKLPEMREKVSRENKEGKKHEDFIPPGKMTNSCFCRRLYNLVGLFENERLPNLPVHFSLHCPLLFHFFSLSPLLRGPLKQSSPSFSLSVNAKMYPRAACGSWSITASRSAYSVSHKSSISCTTLTDSWPLFLQNGGGSWVDKGMLTASLPSPSEWHPGFTPFTRSTRLQTHPIIPETIWWGTSAHFRTLKG